LLCDFANQKIGKYLLALKCLLAAAVLDKEHPKVHEQTIRFRLATDKDLEGVPAKSIEIIKSEFTLLPASTPLTQVNDEYLAKQKDSARGTLSALKVRKLLSPDSASSCEKDVAAAIKLPNITMEEAKEALNLLSSWQSAEVGRFRSSAAMKWPKATVFEASA
jgi:N-alpha-acetyltransferase 15/16, NatA auxiliary subunit